MDRAERVAEEVVAAYSACKVDDIASILRREFQTVWGEAEGIVRELAVDRPLASRPYRDAVLAALRARAKEEVVGRRTKARITLGFGARCHDMVCPDNAHGACSGPPVCPFGRKGEAA